MAWRDGEELHVVKRETGVGSMRNVARRGRMFGAGVTRGFRNQHVLLQTREDLETSERRFGREIAC